MYFLSLRPKRGRITRSLNYIVKLHFSRQIKLIRNVKLKIVVSGQQIIESFAKVKTLELPIIQGVGEPPLVLATSVFLAIKAAIRSHREHLHATPDFQLDCPATVERTLLAIGNPRFTLQVVLRALFCTFIKNKLNVSEPMSCYLFLKLLKLVFQFISC